MNNEYYHIHVSTHKSNSILDYNHLDHLDTSKDEKNVGGWWMVLYAGI